MPRWLKRACKKDDRLQSGLEDEKRLTDALREDFKHEPLETEPERVGRILGKLGGGNPSRKATLREAALEGNRDRDSRLRSACIDA
ncbi:MAG: hypothetical protein CBD18_06215 [Opitutales bacterium TMED158]|nr:MAG: hypothetical protein CBD18_06215 [Opitutales bacterium TMED158]